MLYDIILIALIVILTIIGVRNGIAETLLNIIAAVLTIAAAVVAAQLLSGVIYDAFFRQTIMASVDSTLKDSNLNDTLASAAKVVSLFPVFLMSITGYFGVSTSLLESTFAGFIGTQGTDAADDITGIMQSPVCALIAVVLFFIFLVVFGIIFRVIAGKVERIFKLPMIRSINGILGGVLGFAEGVVCVFALSFVMHLVLPIFNTDIYIFTNEYINTSHLFRLIYNGSLSSLVEGVIYNIDNLKNAIR